MNPDMALERGTRPTLARQRAAPTRHRQTSASGAARTRIKAPEREMRELRQADQSLRKASAYRVQAELDRRLESPSFS